MTQNLLCLMRENLSVELAIDSAELGTSGIFSIMKNDFLHFFRVNNLFLHQSYLKSPPPVKLT